MPEIDWTQKRKREELDQEAENVTLALHTQIAAEDYLKATEWLAQLESQGQPGMDNNTRKARARAQAFLKLLE